LHLPGKELESELEHELEIKVELWELSDFNELNFGT